MINCELRTLKRALGRTILIALIILLAPALSRAADFTASTLGDYGNVTVMEVTGNYDALNADGSENLAARRAVAKEFFRAHKDEYDFLIFFSNFGYQMPTDARAFYQGIRNDISGIGKPPFDNSGLYNDSNVSGRLQGTIDMGNIALLATDPMDPKFNETLYILSHEMMHRWSAYAKFKDASGSDSSALLSKEGNHWSFLLDSSSSLMYGNKWQANGNNTFTSLVPQSEQKFYSPLDLYLMGMLDKSQVPPMLLIENSAIDPNRLPDAGVTISGTARTVTIDDIIAAMGERDPSAATSQKSFKTAFIFLARPGTFTGQEIYGIENIRNGAVTRFSVLTDGRSIMEVASTPKADVQVNPGILPPSTTLRPMANIDEGVTWLIGRQSADGSWMDLAQTMERDTAEAVLTLKPFAVSQTNAQAGLLWLGSTQSLNVDYLCRKIEAMAVSGVDTTELVRDLLERRNSDGGWGSERNYASNAADTALALKALSAAGAGDQQAINKAIQYLRSAQKPVGGWTGNGESTIQATAAALSALNRYRGQFPLDADIAKGTDWLLNKKIGDAFGQNQEATIYDTALAVLVLRELDAATTITNPAVEFLKTRQDVNGSWNSSVFETALAVKAILKGNVDPDLVVRSSDITFTPDTISALPSSVVINVAVSNTGMTAVQEAKIVLYDGAISETNRIGQPVVIAVPGQSPAAVTFSTTISDGNEHTFIAVVTSLDLAKESNENNNRAGKSLQVQTTHDFAVLPGDVSVNPATASLLQDVTITAKISNKGTMTAYSVPVKFFVIAPGGETTIAEVSVDVPANGSVTKSINWRANRAGSNMPITVQVDPQNMFEELSETNNSASTVVTINALTDPNISVSYKDLVVTPDTLLEGGSATISAIVRNDGGSAVSNVVVTFYSTVSGTTRQLPQDAPVTTSIPPLEPGQNAAVSLTWNNIPDPGNTIITVRASPPGGTSEIRTDDNEAFTTVTVRSLPDLTISANAVVIQPSFLKEGDQVAITVAVQNSGDQEAANVIVRALDGATPIGPDQTITLLAGHGTTTVGFSYSATVSKGAHEITVVVDPLNSIIERNKENNRATRSFGVQDADLWVTERYFSPNGDNVKDATELFFRLPSPQTVTVAVVNKKGEIVREFSGTGLQNISSGSVKWDGMNSDDIIADDGEYDLTLKNQQKVTLGVAIVSLDTNRSPLVAAIGTKYLQHQLLNGSGPDIREWTWLPYDSGIVFSLDHYSATSQYPAGIYILSTSSGDIAEITSVNTDTSETQYPVHEYRYELSADGKTLVYVRNRMTSVNQNPVSSQIWKYDLETGRSEIIASYDLTALYVAMAKLSPDGKYLFFKLIHATGTSGELRLLKTDGTNNDLIDAIYPYLGYDYVQWAPDSSKVSFAYTQYDYLPVSGYGNHSYIAVADISGNKWYLLTGAGSPIDELKWINERKIVAFLPWYAEYQLYDATVADSYVQLGGHSEKGMFAVSPDRRSIAFVGSYGGVQTLYLSDESGGSRKLYETSAGINADLRNIMWSPDSSKLSIIDERATYWPNYNFTDHLKLIEVKTGAISEVYSGADYMQPVKLMSDNVTAVSMIGNGLYTINMASGSATPVRDDTYVNEAFVSPQEQAFLYKSGSFWSAFSLMNLTADFGIAPGVNEITIRGTATDLNFSDYGLEYADIRSPASWTPIQPVSDQPVINNVLGTWTPPSSGAYLVRLIAQDKAGNSKTNRKRATWGRRDVISGLSLSRKMFSPNSGGSGNTVSLQYQVSEPVHLTFTVSDAHGAVIRTILRDHAAAGNGNMLWDGLDDQSTTVSDGVYTISVLGYAFSVEVDTTLPAVSARVSLVSKPDIEHPPLKYYLAQVTGHVYDKNIKQWTISYGEGDDPQIWTEIGQGTAVKAAVDEQGALILPFQETNFYEFGEPALGLLGGKKLRILVEDLAGNRSAVVTNFLEDKIIIHTWDEGYVLTGTASGEDIRPEQARPGIHTIGGFETVKRTLTSIRLRYEQSPGVWIDGPEGTEIAAGIYTFAWDTGGLNLQAIRIAVKAVDDQGVEHISNALSTKEDFDLLRKMTTCDLEAHNSIFEELSSLRFLITEPNDKSGSTYHEFSGKGDAYQQPVIYGKFPVELPGLLTGADYYVKMIGTGRNGSNREVSNRIRSCETAGIIVDYRKAGCGEQSNAVKLSATLTAGSSYLLRPSKVAYFIKAAGQWVLLQELAIQGTGIPSLDVNTMGYAEGSYPVRAVITYASFGDASQTIYAEDNVFVDRVLPSAAITYPLQGARVCAQATQTPNGTIFSVPIMGMATDDKKISKYEVFYGHGAQPTSWLSTEVTGAGALVGDLGNWRIDANTKKSLKQPTLKIEAEDAAGNRSCAATSFTLDNSNEVIFTGSEELYLSANSGISINYRLDEPSTIDANVYDISASVDPQTNTAPIAILAAGARQEGNASVVWNGNRTSGGLADEGRYRVVVRVSDDCGNTIERSFIVVIDRTQPSVEIIQPIMEQQLSGIIEVRGTVQDSYLASYELAVGTGDAPTNWESVTTGSTGILDRAIGSWNAIGQTGRWTFRISATDLAGNSAVKFVTVTVSASPGVITSLTSAPRIISPNGDEKRDTATVDYTLNGAADVYLEALNSGGAVVSRSTTSTLTSGAYQRTFTGNSASGVPFDDGDYQLRLIASPSSGPSTTGSQVETVTTTIDSTPPLVIMTSPAENAYVKDASLTVRGSVTDKNMSEVRIVSASASGTTVVYQGSQSRNDNAFGVLDNLADGPYTLSVNAKDLGENETQMTVSFTVDRTPPVVKLSAPMDGAVLGTVHSAQTGTLAGGQTPAVVTVSGSLVEQHLASFTVRYGSGDNPSAWTDLVTGTTISTLPGSYAWNIGNLTDGLYTLSLAATDRAGLIGEATVKLTIDNMPPVVAISSPLEGGYVRTPQDVTGTVTDTNLERYTVDISAGQCAGAFKWVQIKKNNSPVTSGTLASLQALPPDGEYCLRVTATDKIGSSTSVMMGVKVDTTPPAPPSLDGTRQNAVDARLTWSGNTETDLAGFNVYRGGQKLNTGPTVTAGEFTDAGLEEGSYVYTIKALDLAGNESGLSNAVKIRIDLTGPAAKIAKPLGGATAGGFIEIKGTAFSADDFKQYRVSIGQGTAPAAWIMIRTSPLAVSNGVLADLDTLGLGEGQTYSLRLEAEDLAGNITTDRISITVDNTPPQAPDLSQPVVDGSSVTLQWSDSLDNDLAGYLLFVNDRLVNAPSSMTQADMTPYLIPCPSYYHFDMPDGTFTYTAAAVDRAGNMGPLSNAEAVSIDTRAPQIAIVEPVAVLVDGKWKATIGGKTLIRAESPDLDIDHVLFYYSVSGSNTWYSIGESRQAPYEVAFTPATLDSMYDLKAEAVDKHVPLANMGISPVITVTYKDLTPPPVPAGLSATVSGNSIALTWMAAADGDTTEYNVYRTAGGARERITYPAIVKQTAAYQDDVYSDGLYSYDITAKDAAGNESNPSAPVTARVYYPVIDQLATRTTLTTVHVAGSNAAALASVRFETMSSAGTGSIITTADQSGRFSADITLSAGVNTIKATATDSAGNVSNESNFVSIDFDALPDAPTGLLPSVQGSMVTLTWNQNAEPDVTGYLVYRKTNSEWSKITLSAIADITWTDAGLRNGSYQYKVTAVDALSESALSTGVTATVAVDPLSAPVNLVATAQPNGEADITWAYPEGTANGFYLYRGAAEGGPYTRITSALVAATAYRDRGLVNGTTYYYVSTAVDSFGNESDYSMWGSATAVDTTAPEKPLITTPTMSGSPIVVTSPTVTVAGQAESGTTVELFRNGEPVGAVQATGGSGKVSIPIDTYVNGASLSPDGSLIAYASDSGQIQLLDIPSSIVTELTPQGYGPSWSPDGSKIVYESTATYPSQIVIHDVATNTDAFMTENMPANIYTPFSWSADGSKFVFMGYSYGPDVYGYAFWLKDLASGELTPVVVNNDIYESALSPDGGRLAYFQNGSLFVLDLITGQESSISSAADGWSLSWSPDGNRLAFIETMGSGYALYVAVPGSGDRTLVAESAGDLYWTAWFPDGQRIAYSEWDSVSGRPSVKTVAADGTAAPELIEEGLTNVAYLGVTGDGQVSYVDSNADTMQSVLKVVSAGGRFEFRDVALDPGENIFTAMTRDASGNVSSPSDAISVTRDLTQLPDLVVLADDIALYPAAPLAGERTAMSIAVWNRGQTVSREADVSVYVWNESGYLALLAQGKVPALEPGAAHLVSAEWDSAGRTGANRLVAAVDIEQLVPESNETNNMAMLDFFVSGQEGISLTTSLDASQYASDSAVKARVTLRNSGIAKEGILSVTIEDENGIVAAVLVEKTISMAYAFQQEYAFAWNTGATYAGSYRVHAVLNSPTGSLAEHATAFSIVPDTKVSTTVTTDKANYGAGEPVGIAVTLNNLGRNRIIPLLTTRLTITNEAGAVLFSNEKNTSDMLPGASIFLSSVWNTSLSPAGSYTASLETVVDGSPLPVKNALFAVRGSAVVTGTLSVSPDPVPFGAAFRANYMLENSGNGGTGPGMTRVMILDQESQALLSTYENQTALASGSSITGKADFSGLSNSLKTYTAVLQYVTSDRTSVLASAAVIVKDMTAPTMTVLSPATGTPYTSTVSFLAAASDDASGVDRIEYSRDNGSWSLLPVADPSRGRFGTTWDPTMADNGMHTVSFRVVDRAGNRGEETTISYVIQINRAPTAPSPAWPVTGQDVGTVRPEIAVNNASDPNGDGLNYVFELYADSDLTMMIVPAGVVPEGTGTTAWTVPTDLTENAVYYWRAQAFDGKLSGPWTDTASFRVNAVEDPPSVPTPTSPADKTEVATLTPILTVINAVDPDSTSLTYNFQVALDPAFVTIVTSTGGVIGGDGNTSWQVPVPLAEDVRYYWRSQADDWKVTGDWSNPVEFTVNTGNNRPTDPSVSTPANGSEVTTTSPDIELQNSIDPELQVITYSIELDTVKTFDSPNLFTVTGLAQGEVTTTWHVDGLLDNTGYFVRAKASDGAAESDWSGVNAFFVNTRNEPPSTPVPANPSNGAGVNVFTPTLSVQNAMDIDRDTLTYEFEVYEDPGLTAPAVASVAGVVETQGLTSWTVSVTLKENRTYYWRARAFDGELVSEWTAPFSFTVNTGNDAPGAPTIFSPAEGGSVDSAMPTLTVLNAKDPDSTQLTYEFEVFYGSALIWTAPGIAEGTAGSTSATLNVALTDNTVYSWRCRANDGQREGPWTPMTNFTVHLPQTGITVEIEVEPETLSQKSKGNWVMVEIELPHGYKAEDVDISSIKLEGTVPVVVWPHERKKHRHEHGCDDDHREHDHGEIKVKFRRSDVIAILPAGNHVPVHISGTVAGTPFEGVDIIRVIH